MCRKKQPEKPKTSFQAAFPLAAISRKSKNSGSAKETPITKPKTDHIIHALPAFKDSDTAKAIKTSGRFLNYLPSLRSERALRFWRFMEAAGDRWWPHAAAVYALVLSKRVAAPILPERSPQNVLLPEAAFGLSRQGAASACTTEPR